MWPSNNNFKTVFVNQLEVLGLIWDFGPIHFPMFFHSVMSLVYFIFMGCYGHADFGEFLNMWRGLHFHWKAQWGRRTEKSIWSLQSLLFALGILWKLWHLLSKSLPTSGVIISLRLDQQTLLSVEREKKVLTAAKSRCDLINIALDFVKSNSRWWSGAAEGGGWVTDIYEPTHSARHWSSWEKIFTADGGFIIT